MIFVDQVLARLSVGQDLAEGKYSAQVFRFAPATHKELREEDAAVDLVHSAHHVQWQCSRIQKDTVVDARKGKKVEVID